MLETRKVANLTSQHLMFLQRALIADSFTQINSKVSVLSESYQIFAGERSPKKFMPMTMPSTLKLQKNVNTSSNKKWIWGPGSDHRRILNTVKYYFGILISMISKIQT